MVVEVEQEDHEPKEHEQDHEEQEQEQEEEAAVCVIEVKREKGRRSARSCRWWDCLTTTTQKTWTVNLFLLLTF